MTTQLPDRLEHLLDNAWQIPDCSLVIACETAQQAAELTTKLYDENSDEVFHIEHYPVTDDDAGTVQYYALLLRRLTYDRDMGWFSADVSSDPDFDLRGSTASDDENDDLRNYTTFSVSNERRYVVAAETVHDPYHNYTILGHIIELDRCDFDSDHAAATEAARQAVDVMPESLDDIIDDEFHVFEIDGQSLWVNTDDV